MCKLAEELAFQENLGEQKQVASGDAAGAQQLRVVWAHRDRTSGAKARRGLGIYGPTKVVP